MIILGLSSSIISQTKYKIISKNTSAFKNITKISRNLHSTQMKLIKKHPSQKSYHYRKFPVRNSMQVRPFNVNFMLIFFSLPCISFIFPLTFECEVADKFHIKKEPKENNQRKKKWIMKSLMYINVLLNTATNQYILHWNRNFCSHRIDIQHT